MNDTGSWLPETDVELSTGSGKEIENLLVDVDGSCEILGTSNLGLDKMIAMNSGWVSHGWHASRHELEDSHLSGGILASNTIWAESQVRDTTLDLLSVWVIQVRVEDLLGVGEWAVETLANNVEVLGHLLVVDVVALLVDVLADLLVKNIVRDGGHRAAHGLLGNCPPWDGTKKLSRCQHDDDVMEVVFWRRRGERKEERKRATSRRRRLVTAVEARLLDPRTYSEHNLLPCCGFCPYEPIRGGLLGPLVGNRSGCCSAHPPTFTTNGNMAANEDEALGSPGLDCAHTLHHRFRNRSVIELQTIGITIIA